MQLQGTVVAVDLRGLHEPLPGIGHERIEPYPLAVGPMAFVTAIHTATARGKTDVDPVGYTVTMSGKARGIDEGLGQEGPDAVGGHPIGGDRA